MLSKHFKLRDLGPTRFILGVEVQQDLAARSVSLSQRQYIVDMLERYNMTDCNPVGTPMAPGLKLDKTMGPKTAEDVAYMQTVPYLSAIGSLQYLATMTRPDIAYAVTRLSKYNANPSEAHMNYAKYVLRYLQGTKAYRLRYKGTSNDGLISYSDSDWAEDRDDRHSTSGFIFLMAGGAISWASRRQPTISLSSTKAEYKAASDTCCQLTWLRTFGSELGDDVT